MSSRWFETVAVAQRRARKRLPKSVYWSIVAGSEQGTTLKDNVAALGELGFTPHAGGLPAKRDLATTVLGQELSMPVLCSPTGVQAVHPDGEVAVARAAASRGTAVGLSSFGSKPVEQVAAANHQTFFQMYWIGGRDRMQARVEPAGRRRAAGAGGHHRHVLPAPGRARRRLSHRGAHLGRDLRRGRAARRAHDHQPPAGAPPGRGSRARGMPALRPRRATTDNQRQPNCWPGIAITCPRGACLT